MAGVKCFLLEPTTRSTRTLRRYAQLSKGVTCNSGYAYHDARAPLDQVDGNEASGDLWPHDDPRWPSQCVCGYRFADVDEWQLFTERLYRRMDTGEEMTLRDAPPGAMWYADWMLVEGRSAYRGPDGRCLAVKLPDGHHWTIDGRASNCTMPDDNEHRCWVRHGTPPCITVDKNGLTCQAGAGSILAPNGWHGFLRNGVFDGC